VAYLLVIIAAVVMLFGVARIRRGHDWRHARAGDYDIR
jgi:hypothetical protein